MMAECIHHPFDDLHNAARCIKDNGHRFFTAIRQLNSRFDYIFKPGYDWADYCQNIRI